MKILVTSLLAAGLCACSFAARSPEMYRDDTQKVLAERSSDIKSCYDGILKSDKTAAGTVVVNFIVAEDTGVIQQVKADAAKSTAPEAVQSCVVDAIGEGLKIVPPDARKGIATFTWEFEVAPQRRAEPKESSFSTES
jgi:hypothetical protein